MTLEEVKQVVLNIKNMLQEMIQAQEITSEQANIIFPIILNAILTKNSVGSS